MAVDDMHDWQTLRLRMGLGFALAGVLGACDSPATEAGTFVGSDGGRFESTCTAPPGRYDPCGEVQGQPFYTFYDGCNWCGCADGGIVCTLRACDAPRPAEACRENLYGRNSTPADGETWVCDTEGRWFRSACLPSGMAAP